MLVQDQFFHVEPIQEFYNLFYCASENTRIYHDLNILIFGQIHPNYYFTFHIYINLEINIFRYLFLNIIFL